MGGVTFKKCDISWHFLVEQNQDELEGIVKENVKQDLAIQADPGPEATFNPQKQHLWGGEDSAHPNKSFALTITSIENIIIVCD